MGRDESQRRAAAKYNKNNTKVYSLKLNKNTEMELITFLDGIENRNLYLKTLIREDMERKERENY